MRRRPSKRLAAMFAIAAVLLNFDAAFACSTKAKMYVTAMKSDLRNLVSAQEAFHADSQRFTASLDALGFRKSTGVASVTFDQITDAGWSATATHAQVPSVCHIFVGARPSGVPASVADGEPWCDVKESVSFSEKLGAALAVPTWLFLIVLTIVTRKFLRPRGIDWATWGLIVVLAPYTLLTGVMWQCPEDGGLEVIAVFMALGLGIFALAVRRRVVTA